MKKIILTRIEKIILIGMCIEAATGVAGTAVILKEGHPYLTIGILITGAVATKIVTFIERKEMKYLIKEGAQDKVVN